MTTSKRLAGAALVASMALGACAQSHQRVTAPSGQATAPPGQATAPPGQATAPPPASTIPGQVTTLPQAGATMTLGSVRATTAALRSYSYRASTTTTAQNGSVTTDTFTGNVVSPDRVHYTATVGRNTFEIIRIGSTSYRRQPGRPWTKLPAQNSPPPPPAATLLAVLDRLGPLSVPPGGKVSATLSPGDANSAGLASGPGITEPVTVNMTVDPAGHVAHFDATVKINDPHTHATLHTQTDFADYDKPGDITAPI